MSVLDEIEIRVREDEPLLPGALEVDLHARVRTAAFVIDDDTISETRMTHALAEFERRCIRNDRGRAAAAVNRTTDLHGVEMYSRPSRFLREIPRT